MSESITPDEAIAECLKVGAMGISLGLAKQLQAERDDLRAQLTASNKAREEAKRALKQKELDRQYHMNAINKIAGPMGMLGETSAAIADAAFSRIANLACVLPINKFLDAALRQSQETVAALVAGIKDIRADSCGLSHPEDYACCLAEAGVESAIDDMLASLPEAVQRRLARDAAREAVVEAAKSIKAERRKTIQTGTFNSAEMLDAVDGMDQALARLAALDGEGAKP